VTEDEEILLAFLEESRENLDQLDRDLVDLEASPQDPELLARVFRVVHTIKGTCGFLGFTKLEDLAHTGEDLLGALRCGDLLLDQSLTTVLLGLVDVLRTVLTAIETTSEEPPGDHELTILELRRHLPADIDPDKAVSGGVPAEAPGPASAHVAETSVRVEVTVLDKLLDLVGELVLARSRIGELAAADDSGPLAGPYRDLRIVSGELQDSVMTARLQPIGTVTAKFHRVARDLAAALGKQVTVELTGEDVGVDKALNEALRDPLLHLVRNALDHGIESPAERLAVGKPAAGQLRIRASHEGGRVYVEVSDDGRGVDPDALRAKAVAAGLLGADEAAGLSEIEALDLMFHAGLSTKDSVTSTSGRGVGMDVVRTSLEPVGGSIDVASTPGRGVTFRLNIPLTLAIMPVLIVSGGGSDYAVPQVQLREVVSLDGTAVAERVDAVEGARLLRLRGQLLPLVSLTERLAVSSMRGDGALLIVVVEAEGRRFGLVVDDVGDTIDAVVKPLPRLLRGIAVFAGTTILGDGRPALLLDVAGLADVAGIAASDHQEVGQVDGVTPSATSAGLLLATAPDGGRLAVRIGRVRRLESFALERVERAGDREVVQYGDELLPLARVAVLLPERRRVDRETPPAGALEGVAAVVCETAVGLVGFVVGSIDDVVPEPTVPRQPPSRAGVEACVVVGDRVAELLDLDSLAAAAGIGAAT
jgi:two-component system chemotaxis sensor kinase CheA